MGFRGPLEVDSSGKGCVCACACMRVCVCVCVCLDEARWVESGAVDYIAAGRGVVQLQVFFFARVVLRSCEGVEMFVFLLLRVTPCVCLQKTSLRRPSGPRK